MIGCYMIDQAAIETALREVRQPANPRPAKPTSIMPHVDNSGTFDAVPLISTRSAVGPPPLFTMKSIVFTPGLKPELIENEANPIEN